MKTDNGLQKHPVHYYYKDPETGVEMNFSKYSDWGWTISFPHTKAEDAFFFEGKIPWPELSTEEQAVVDENYKNLHRMIREEDDESDN